MTDPIGVLQSILGDRYVVQGELGRGGMANVYLAQDTKHDREVAVKVLRPELGALLGAERFLHEIKLTSRLQHPHILPLYDSGQHETVLYYVMPYVKGESLREKIRRERRMKLEEAVMIAREVSDALSYAHEHNIIHRDIKPENILLSGGHALVADFGIARAISRSGGEKWQTLTASGVAIGTPAYMSPEQTVGMQDLDARSDVYAVGCVLYEMLTGAPPFIGPDGELMVARRFTEPAPLVSATRETVPPPIDQAVAKALSREPGERFATATEFADALSSIFTTVSNPVAAPPPARPIPRRALWIGTIALVTGVVATAVLALIVRPHLRGATTSVGPVATAAADSAPRSPVGQPETPPPVSSAASGSNRPTSGPAVKSAAGAGTAGRTGAAVTAAPPVTQAAPAHGDSLPAGLRNSALAARRRAAEAGALAAELAVGDMALDSAESLALAGHLPDALTHATAASAAWMDAERAARTRALAAAAPVNPPASTTTAAPPPAPAPVDPRPAISAVVSDYAAAIQARDIAAIRRVYPNLTDAQRTGWTQFFQSLRSMKAALSVTSLDVNGDAARATVAGTYDYVDASGHAQHQPVTFQLQLRRDGTAWHISDVK